MFAEYAGVRVLRVFMDDPEREVYVREVAGLAGVSVASAKKYLDLFFREGLLLRRKQANLLIYRGNLDNPAFRQIRIARSVFRLVRCGLLDALLRTSPRSVVLFGSTARGEDRTDSDVDIFVLGKSVDVDLSKFEKTLRRRINLIVYDERAWEKKSTEDRPFYDSVVLQGIVLYGEPPVV